ncbi:hypothetical protein JOF53_001747 [Crossiella equi]|uniref:Uncharacterized protein n=1 Tax=Crossiella equi TaxID=130796 RepID=A0ABS5A8F8_9PSEU|nr:hypothetical protein [Crossiella equi]MBP2472875.1 hypothetical protein [Crossiella equi]
MTEQKFQLPPPRELPEDIRERMRASVRMRMDDPGFRPESKGRRLLAAAAAIVVVAAGAAVVVQSAQDDQNAASPPSGTTSSRQLDLNNPSGVDKYVVDRCWQAAMASPHATRYPLGRTFWAPRFQYNEGGTSTVTLALGDRTAVCEVSKTTVWLSEPQAPMAATDPVPVRSLMTSPSGGVWVQTRPDVKAAGLSVDQRARGGQEYTRDLADVRGHVFGGGPRWVLDGAKVSVSTDTGTGTPVRTELTKPVPPLVVSVDEPAATAERTSPAGLRVQACADYARTKQFVPVLYTGELVPGAYGELPGGRAVQVASFRGNVLACTFQDGKPVWPVKYSQSVEPGRLGVHFQSHSMITTSSSSSPDVQYGTVEGGVARLVVRTPGRPDTEAVLAGGTYLVPASYGQVDPRSRFTGYDAEGKQLWEAGWDGT